MARVAFIGLGRMGHGMAGRLLASGHELIVFNRTLAKAVDLIAGGASWAESPREAAGTADAVIVMVSDDGASRSVWQRPDGVLAAALVPGTWLIECSTLSHSWVCNCRCKARPSAKPPTADRTSATPRDQLDTVPDHGPGKGRSRYPR